MDDQFNNPYPASAERGGDDTGNSNNNGGFLGVKSENLFKRLSRIALFYFIGFTLFFLAGYLIVSVNIIRTNKVRMPHVVGRLYLDEHNHLSNLGLPVKLEETRELVYPYGYIVSQSVPAGKIIKEGTIVTLLVNYSKEVVPVPALAGKHINMYEQMINEIPVEDVNLSLAKGTITYIPNERPEGIIIEQHPSEGTWVRPETPVSILVSSGPEKLSFNTKLPDLRGVPVEIAKRIAFEIRYPIEITTEKTGNYTLDGLIKSYNVPKNPEQSKKWNVVVYDAGNGAGKKYPGQYHWLRVPESLGYGNFYTLLQRDEIIVGGKKKTIEKYSYIEITSGIPVYLREQSEFFLWKDFYNVAPEVVIETSEKKIPVFADLDKDKVEGDEKARDPDFTKLLKSVQI